MRLVIAVILAVALGAAAQAPVPDSDPVSLIKAIYKTYETDDPGLPHVYSKRLQALVEKDERETPEGEVGRIDWDVFIDGQDWRLTGLNIALVAKIGRARPSPRQVQEFRPSVRHAVRSCA